MFVRCNTQERALLTQLDIGAGQLWIADRNFCVRSFLSRIAQAQSCFLVRWHRSRLPFDELTPLREAVAGQPGLRSVTSLAAPGFRHRRTGTRAADVIIGVAF